MKEKVKKINRLIILLFIFCSMFLVSCVKLQECRWITDLERIAKQVAQVSCSF